MDSEVGSMFVGVQKGFQRLCYSPSLCLKERVAKIVPIMRENSRKFCVGWGGGAKNTKIFKTFFCVFLKPSSERSRFITTFNYDAVTIGFFQLYACVTPTVSKVGVIGSMAVRNEIFLPK